MTGDAGKTLYGRGERWVELCRSAEIGLWEFDRLRGTFWRTPMHDRIFGYGALQQEWTFERFLEHVVPEDREMVTGRFYEAARAREPIDMSFRIHRTDGALRWIWVHGRIDRDGNGEPIQVCGLIRDITVQKAAEEALRENEERLRFALDAANMGIWDWDLSNGGLDWTDGCKALFAIDPGTEMTYERFLEAIHPDDRKQIDQLVRGSLEHHEVYMAEIRVPWPDGTIHWIAAKGRGFYDESGRAARMAGVGIDITERRSAELAVYESEERARKLVEELREVDRRKNEFLAMLSHELRNPLASIQSGLSILEQVEPDGEQARRARAIIGRQFSQLTHLVGDLLDVTRITQNKIRLQRKPVELNGLVRRAIEDHQALFETSGVNLEAGYVQSPVVVNADAARLAQAVGNLLLNAAKFTPRGGSAHVSVGLNDAGQAVITVKDTGVGLSPDVQIRLFEPFMQADTSLDRSQGGLGLGLALVKGLVEQHGGEVTASSPGPGMGAEFVVRLPLYADWAQEPRAALPESPFRRRRILLVDDNVDLTKSLCELLQLNGHEVAAAFSGPEGLERAKSFRPEVVLCDIGLPGLTGYDVARELRADKVFHSVFLIALTGYALPEDMRRVEEAGFNRHVAKPVDLPTLMRALNEAP